MGVVSPSRAAGQLPGWRYWLRRLLPDVALTPTRIAVVYGVFGMLALFGSDVLLVRYVDEPLLSQVQALKGAAEVAVSAGLIFVLAGRREAQLQRTVRALDQSQQELEVLHRVLRHNLRNDLNVLMGVSETIRERDPCAPVERAGERLERVVGEIEQYTEQANRIRGITERNGRAHTFDVADVLADVVERRAREHEAVTMDASLPEDALVEANAMLPGALEELVDNAIEHNDTADPAVAVTVDRGDGAAMMTTIRILDDGPPIPDTELEPLREGTEDQIVHLTGMGLWFVTWTVRHSDGEISFEERAGGGNAVTVRLPRAPGDLTSELSPLNAD